MVAGLGVGLSVCVNLEPGQQLRNTRVMCNLSLPNTDKPNACVTCVTCVSCSAAPAYTDLHRLTQTLCKKCVTAGGPNVRKRLQAVCVSCVSLRILRILDVIHQNHRTDDVAIQLQCTRCHTS